MPVRSLFLMLFTLLVAGCASLVSFQPSNSLVEEGVPLDQIISEAQFFAGEGNIHYWCDERKEAFACHLGCQECRVVIVDLHDSVVFLEGSGDNPVVRRVDQFQLNKLDFLRTDSLISYESAWALLSGKVVNGMTVAQIKAAREFSRIEEKYWCSFTPVQRCDESCLDCRAVLLEYDLQSGRDKTIYLDNRIKPVGVVDFVPRVYKQESGINLLAQPM